MPKMVPSKVGPFEVLRVNRYELPYGIVDHCVMMETDKYEVVFVVDIDERYEIMIIDRKTRETFSPYVVNIGLPGRRRPNEFELRISSEDRRTGIKKTKTESTIRVSQKGAGTITASLSKEAIEGLKEIERGDPTAILQSVVENESENEIVRMFGENFWQFVIRAVTFFRENPEILSPYLDKDHQIIRGFYPESDGDVGTAGSGEFTRVPPVTVNRLSNSKKVPSPWQCADWNNGNGVFRIGFFRGMERKRARHLMKVYSSHLGMGQTTVLPIHSRSQAIFMRDQLEKIINDPFVGDGHYNTMQVTVVDGESVRYADDVNPDNFE